MSHRDQAIAYIEECRDIHHEWAEAQDNDSDWEAKVQPTDVGEADWHKQWVAKYELVLSVLNGAVGEGPSGDHRI